MPHLPACSPAFSLPLHWSANHVHVQAQVSIPVPVHVHVKVHAPYPCPPRRPALLIGASCHHTGNITQGGWLGLGSKIGQARWRGRQKKACGRQFEVRCHDEVAFGTKAKLPQPRRRVPQDTTLCYFLPIITYFFSSRRHLRDPDGLYDTRQSRLSPPTNNVLAADTITSIPSSPGHKGSSI